MPDIPHYLESTVAENGSVQDELLLALAKGGGESDCGPGAYRKGTGAHRRRIRTAKEAGGI